MKRSINSFFAIGVFYTAVACLLVPAEVDAQSPPQGPPTASANAHSVLSNNLTKVLADTIQPAVDAENARLATDPNFRAVITATPVESLPFMGQTTNLYQPNQFFADVPYSVLYDVSKISVKVNGSFVPYPQTAVIGQDVSLQATCQGWFTGKGNLTYAAVPSQAGYVGTTNFPNPEVGTLLQQVIPNFVNTTVNARFATYGTGSDGALVDSGAACRTLGVPQIAILVQAQTQTSSQPQDAGSPSIFFDPPPPSTTPITNQQNTVTVTVKSIRRLQLHGISGEPLYEAVESPILDFFAGFTHLHIELPTMTEGQTFTPVNGNIAETPVAVETGNLVVLGVMTYDGLSHQDPAFLTFSRNLDYGAGEQILDTPKQTLVRGFVLSSQTSTIANSNSNSNSSSSLNSGYEITLEVTAPPVQIGAAP